MNAYPYPYNLLLIDFGPVLHGVFIGLFLGLVLIALFEFVPRVQCYWNKWRKDN
jgi:hypothetical protein